MLRYGHLREVLLASKQTMYRPCFATGTWERLCKRQNIQCTDRVLLQVPGRGFVSFKTDNVPTMLRYGHLREVLLASKQTMYRPCFATGTWERLCKRQNIQCTDRASLQAPGRALLGSKQTMYRPCFASGTWERLC